MFTITFWKDAAERAIRTSAQALLALWATNISGLLEVDLVQSASVAALAAITSILMSIAATGVGNSQDASAIK